MYNRNRIALARELRGMTQLNLAKKTGIFSQIELSGLETGRIEITSDHIQKIASAVNLPLHFFFKGRTGCKTHKQILLQKKEYTSCKGAEYFGSAN